MVIRDEDDASFRNLLSDPSLLSVFAISFIGAVGSNSIPAAMPAIGQALGVGSGRLGLVLSVFYLPLIIINPVAGVLADIYGRKRVVIPALFLFGISGIAVLAVDQFEVLLALRVLQAVAFAGTLPLTAALVGDLYDGVAGSTAQGLRSSTNGIANSAAPLVAGLLAALNWRYPFLLFTLAWPIMGLFYLFYSEPMDSTEQSDTLNELRSELGSYWIAFRARATDRNLGVLLLGGFTLFFLKQGMKAYVPVFIVQVLGAKVSTGGFILGVYGAVRVLIAPLAGSISDRVGRKYGLIGAILVLGISIGVIPFMETIRTLTVAVGVFAIGEAVFNPVLSSSVADLAGDDNRGGIMGGLSMVKATANTVSPAIIGFVVVIAGFETAFLLPAILGYIYAGSIYVLLDRRQVETTL